MDFLYNLGNRICELGEDAADKAKSVAEVVKLRNKMRDDDIAIKNSYAEMGKVLYAHLVHGIELTDVSSQITAIDEHMKDKELCREYIRAIRGTDVCPECGEEIERGASFCQHCGAKMA